MRTPAWMTLKSRVSATALVSAMMAASLAGGGLLSTSVAHAQSAAVARGLPDFTDLVDQVGPSVVNIRTLEKVSNNGAEALGMDEDMLEFFRRFGLPVPNVPRQRSPKGGRRGGTATGCRVGLYSHCRWLCNDQRPCGGWCR